MYVILQPHSNTNPSDKYRVVQSEDWAAVANGDKLSVAVAGEFSEHSEAVKLQDRLNYEITKDRLNSSFLKWAGATHEED